MNASLSDMVFSTAMSYPFRWLGNLFVGDFVPVFMLHRIKNKELGVRGADVFFLRQALELVHKYQVTPITLDQVLLAKESGEALPKNPVVFTIDDGFFDSAEVAIPLFLEYGIPVTCFLLSGFLDGDLWPWDDKLTYCFYCSRAYNKSVELENGCSFVFDGGDTNRRELRDCLKKLPIPEQETVLAQLAVELEVSLPQEPPEAYRPMTWQQARCLEKSGAVFGCHGVSHHIFSNMTDAEAIYEVEHASHRLETELEHPSRIFCYPTGRDSDFTERDKALVAQNGYIGAVSTNPGAFCPGADDVFSIPRYSMPDNIVTFRQYLSWLEYWRNRHN